MDAVDCFYHCLAPVKCGHGFQQRAGGADKAAVGSWNKNRGDKYGGSKDNHAERSNFYGKGGKRFIANPFAPNAKSQQYHQCEPQYFAEDSETFCNGGSYLDFFDRQFCREFLCRTKWTDVCAIVVFFA